MTCRLCDPSEHAQRFLEIDADGLRCIPRRVGLFSFEPAVRVGAGSRNLFLRKQLGVYVEGSGANDETDRRNAIMVR